MSALCFAYSEPDDSEEAYSQKCIRPQQKLVLNKKIASFEAETVVEPLNYMAEFVQALVDNVKVVFAYSSAFIKPDDSPPEPYSVCMEGELRKCGNSHQTWHMRHFELKCSKLTYYRSENAIKSIKSIKLENTEIVRKDETNFTLKTGQEDRVWRFQAKDRASCEAWIRAIKEASIYCE